MYLLAIKHSLTIIQQRLVAAGQSVTPMEVVPGTTIKFEGGLLVLDKGGVLVNMETANRRQLLQMASKARFLTKQLEAT